jgi:DeoR/GlpR family transcriptional regulator of sugar metabolism
LGGSYYKHCQITLGIDVINQVKNINADLFFIGVNGIHPERGLSIRNYEESIIKQTMMQSSKKTICCVVEEKLDLVEPYKVAGIEAIDTLVTNLKPQHEQLASYKSEKLNIL